MMAHLIIADSEKNANLYYATQFLAPDPFIFARINGKRVLVMSDLELDRAKSQARSDEVLSCSKLAQKLKAQGIDSPTMVDIADELLKSLPDKMLEVPANFSVSHADELRKKGYVVKPKDDPFFPERMVKANEEISLITQTLRFAEEALQLAIELIQSAEVKNDATLWLKGAQLTAESVRKNMHLSLMEHDCVAQHTIVACGMHSVDPHIEGSGPLRANEPIVIDVFPRHVNSRYFADISRTVVKGKASDRTKRAFNAVKEGQEIAFRMIKDGVDGKSVHQAILESFEKAGFATGEKDGRMQGFFHGTGHGVGLEIHEPPKIGRKSYILKSGMVATVEPGLYYADVGGMRIEDMIVVTKSGCRVLTEAPKVLEL